MGTKLMKNAKKSLLGVSVDISEQERMQLNAFFGFRGMKSRFAEAYINIETEKPKYARRELYAALESGSVKTTLLADIREFVEEHKHEVEEFIKALQTL